VSYKFCFWLHYCPMIMRMVSLLLRGDSGSRRELWLWLWLS